MRTRFLTTAISMSVRSVVFAQGTVSVDVLDPSETSGTIPDNTRIVDLYFDVAASDVWNGGGPAGCDRKRRDDHLF